MKLTKPQKNHLLRIVAAHDRKDKNGQMLPAGWFNTMPEQALVEKGLVRHWSEQKPFGGGGAIGLMVVTWNFCEPTDEGWEVAAELLK